MVNPIIVFLWGCDLERLYYCIIAGKNAKNEIPEEKVFVESAFNVQTYLVKNTLLHADFSAEFCRLVCWLHEGD